MPSCIFCGVHVIPANVKDGLPAVCTKCNLHLDALTEDRINAAVEGALKNYEMPEDAIQQAIAGNLGGFIEAKIQGWEIDFKQRMDTLVKECLQDLKISDCSPDILALEDKITDTVQKTLCEGIANMKPKHLSRGRKKAA